MNFVKLWTMWGRCQAGVIKGLQNRNPPWNWMFFCHSSLAVLNFDLQRIVILANGGIFGKKKTWQFIVAYTEFPKIRYYFVICCGLLCFGTDLYPISFRVTSQALGQSDDCPSASEATLENMGINHMDPLRTMINTIKQVSMKVSNSFNRP